MSKVGLFNYNDGDDGEYLYNRGKLLENSQNDQKNLHAHEQRHENYLNDISKLRSFTRDTSRNEFFERKRMMENHQDKCHCSNEHNTEDTNSNPVGEPDSLLKSVIDAIKTYAPKLT